LSVGWWKVTDARPKTFIAKNTVIHIAVAAAEVVIAGRDGKNASSWQVDSVEFDVYGNSNGVMRLDSNQISITSTERRLARDLRDAINQRRTPPPERPDPAEVALALASNGWILPAVLRQYRNDEGGQQTFAHEADIFDRHGYRASAQSVDGGHVHVGRLLVTAGWSVIAGKSGIRSDATITVTFQKVSGATTSVVTDTDKGRPAGLDIRERLAQLDELHGAGVVTDEEYAARRAKILDEI
jgi:hypothetical protein